MSDRNLEKRGGVKGFVDDASFGRGYKDEKYLSEQQLKEMEEELEKSTEEKEFIMETIKNMLQKAQNKAKMKKKKEDEENAN